MSEIVDITDNDFIYVDITDNYINAYLTVKRARKTVSKIIDNGVDNLPDNIQQALINTYNDLNNIVNAIQEDMNRMIGEYNG